MKSLGSLHRRGYTPQRVSGSRLSAKCQSLPVQFTYSISHQVSYRGFPSPVTQADWVSDLAQTIFTARNGHVSRGVNVKLYGPHNTLTKAFGVINGELDPNKSQARSAYHVDWVPEDYRVLAGTPEYGRVLIYEVSKTRQATTAGKRRKRLNKARTELDSRRASAFNSLEPFIVTAKCADKYAWSNSRAWFFHTNAASRVRLELTGRLLY